MKALVTGAAGFIGSTLIEELTTLGFEVYALAGKSASHSNLDGLTFQYVQGELSDYESLCRATAEMDYIFHLESATTARSRSAYYEQNAKSTERIARAVASKRPSLNRFVYVSSLAAAGPSQSLKPRVETEKDQPVSDYGKSLLEGERELLKYRDVYPISIVRPAVVYGPKDLNGLMMTQTLARNLMPVLQGSTQGGHKYYSSIHAKDLCRGIVQAAVASKRKVPSGEVFFLSGDGFHTYVEMMMAIAERLNCDPLKVRIPKFAIKVAAAGLSTLEVLTRKTFPLNLDKLNEVLPDYWICSNQKAKKMLGFAPEFDLTTGIAHCVEWYKRQRWI